MDINEIKEELGMKALHFTFSEDGKGIESEEWLSHWDNTQRKSVSIHLDTLKTIQGDTEINILALQEELGVIAKESGESYDRYRIVKFKEPFATL